MTVWTRVPLSTATDVAEADGLASRLFELSGLWPHSQNVYWLLSWARGSPENVRLYVTSAGGDIAGLAGCIAEDCEIKIGFRNSIRVHSFRLRRLRLQEPLLSRHFTDEISRQDALSDLFRQIRRENPSYTLYFEAIKVGSATHRLLSANLIRSCYHVQQYGFDTARNVIDLPSTYEEYFDTIGPETRRSLRRSFRKLYAKFPEQVRLDTFRDCGDVDRFFSEVNRFVTRTWQWKRGDNMSPTIIKKFNNLSHDWARRGYFRGYILYVKDQPVAYMIGYRIRNTFHWEVTGFDSDWRKWAVGVVCFLLSLRSMLAETPRLTCFDFLSWDFDYKERFGNRKWLEANYYAFPKELRLSMIYYIFKANIISSNWLRRLYQWYNAGRPSAVAAGAAQGQRESRPVGRSRC